MNKMIIRGAGGGGKGGGGAARAPVEAPDTLQSRAYARVIDLIGEGEIEGLSNGLQSVFLNETPIQNADGSYNFQGFYLETRVGTQAQSYLQGFSAVENELAVGLEVKQGTPLVRTIASAEINAVRVRISLPALSSVNTSNGDISGTSVTLAIDIQTAGAGYVERLRDTISGKASNKYERSYVVPLSGSGPWDVRVRRITADSTKQTLQNKTFWESYTEIINSKLRYPNSALVALGIDASQFQGIPRRGYQMKLLRIKVPVNYDPVARTYAGTWDGTFKIAWTNNPAWVLYDLLTSQRYGLGDFVATGQVDKWGLYQIARYCDEPVPDGLGGTEPRFTCNAYLQTQAEAYRVIQDLASIFRGMVFWANGTIMATQDAPGDAVYLFTTANVIDGAFQYSGASLKARHTVALVSWNDPEDFYRQKIEYVEDADAIARFGIVQTQVTAFGCTSRGQANRVGRWLLYSEASESETVSFATGIEGAVVYPGQLIKIADPARTGQRLGGRLAAASVTSLTLDASPEANLAGWTISVLLPDGTLASRAVKEQIGPVLSLALPLATAPQAAAIWIASSPVVEAQLFRVLSVSEVDGSRFQITAIKHNPGKYAAIEQEVKLEPRNITLLSGTPAAPSNVQVRESLYESQAEVRVNVNISWDPVLTATGYVVTFAVNDGNPQTMTTTTADIDLRDAVTGNYRITVRAENAVGVRGPASSPIEKEIFGKTLPPSNVSGFSMVPLADLAYLTWDKAVDLDVLVGGSVRIRHTPNATAPDWKNAVDLLPALAGTATSAQAPLLAGTYLAKFVDSSGFASPAAAMVVTSVPAALSANVIKTVTESPNFSGAKFDVFVSDDLQALALCGRELWDARVDEIDGWPALDSMGGIVDSGIYAFGQTVDLGAVYASRVSALLRIEGFDATDLMDYRTNDLDHWLDIDGNVIDDVNAQLQMRTTNDAPGALAAWTEWKPFFVSDYQARAFEFRLLMTSASPTHNLAVRELQVTVDMPDRFESAVLSFAGTGVQRVSYPNAFKETPQMGVTAANMVSGDYFTISGADATGFDIVFRNAAGSLISRQFNYLARGFGRRA